MKKNPAYAWQKKLYFFYILISPNARIWLSLSLYQKVPGDGWLLHAVEGALRRCAGFEIKEGLYQALTLVRVASSHHEVILLGVIVIGLLRALCVVNGWGGHIDAEVFRVAGVDDIVWVGGLLQKEKIEELKRNFRVADEKVRSYKWVLAPKTCNLLADFNAITQVISQRKNLEHYSSQSSTSFRNNATLADRRHDQ